MLGIPGKQYPVDELPAVYMRLWQTFTAPEPCSYACAKHVFWIPVLDFTDQWLPCVDREFTIRFEGLAASTALVGNSVDAVQVLSDCNVRPSE
jgi:hypothetical protein